MNEYVDLGSWLVDAGILVGGIAGIIAIAFGLWLLNVKSEPEQKLFYTNEEKREAKIMNYPEGAFYESDNPINDRTKISDMMEIPTECPICGGNITEFLYSYECDDCSWEQYKEEI